MTLQGCWAISGMNRENVRRKVRGQERYPQVSNTQIKNEPVVGRNICHRAEPCKGAKLTLWIWEGRTKEVRTHVGRRDNLGRHGRYRYD